jgi:hypothetical protein
MIFLHPPSDCRNPTWWTFGIFLARERSSCTFQRRAPCDWPCFHFQHLLFHQTRPNFLFDETHEHFVDPQKEVSPTCSSEDRYTPIVLQVWKSLHKVCGTLLHPPPLVPFLALRRAWSQKKFLPWKKSFLEDGVNYSVTRGLRTG